MPSIRTGTPRRTAPAGQQTTVPLVCSFPHRGDSGFTSGRLLLLLLAVIGWLGIIGLLLGPLQHIKQLRQQLAQRQQQLTELEVKNQTLTQHVQDSENIRKTLDERLDSLRTQLASATTDLERLRASLSEARRHEAQLQEEQRELHDQVVLMTSERDEARRQVERAREERVELRRSLDRFRERLALLDRDHRKVTAQLAELQAAPHPDVNVIAPMEPTVSQGDVRRSSPEAPSPSTIPGTIELPPIIVRRGHIVGLSPIQGYLLEVNPSHRFVILDQGGRDGVRMGMLFSIVRGASTIGRILATRVRSDLSACDILPSPSSIELHVGDLARQASP